ncbi:MAG: WD40/YVTN/BNR-like repeat-containing protein [Candidatus Methylacidiphilales bacterium]
MNKIKWIIIGLCWLMASKLTAQYAVQMLDSNSFVLGKGVVLSKTSFRGLSVVNDSVIWVSGSKGTFAKSVDGGKTFVFTQLPDYTKSDFRDIEAFDEKEAIMISSGSPAYILKTEDGGNTWEEVYKNMDSAVFLDGMDFWNKTRGVIVGDPIKNHFLLLYTIDGGANWKEMDRNISPKAMSGEAVFAASGTSIRCWGKSEFGFVSGGSSANYYWFSSPYAKSIRSGLNIQQGANSKGAFSLVRHNKSFFAVGGDYLNDSGGYKNFDEIGVNLYYEDLGSRPFGYRSCIEKVSPTIFIACGTNGVDVFNYKNKSWELLSKQSFNVVKKAKSGKAVFMAGNKGKIGKVVVN